MRNPEATETRTKQLLNQNLRILNALAELTDAMISTRKSETPKNPVSANPGRARTERHQLS